MNTISQSYGTASIFAVIIVASECNARRRTRENLSDIENRKSTMTDLTEGTVNKTWAYKRRVVAKWEIRRDCRYQWGIILEVSIFDKHQRSLVIGIHVTAVTPG